MNEYTFAVYLQDGIKRWGSIKAYILTFNRRNVIAMGHFIYCIFTIKSEIKNIQQITDKSHAEIKRKLNAF